MSVATADVDRFLHFVVERQRAADRRAVGEPWPWSDDPVIRGYKFCSVVRDDDRTSREAREIILGLPERLRLPTALGFRLYNRVSTLVALRDAGVLGAEDSATILRVLEGLEEDAFCRWAYRINIGAGGFYSKRDTARALAQAERAVRRGDFALRRSGRRSAEAVRGALGINAPFCVGQIVQDLRWLGGPYEDDDEWAVIGPGAVRGLARLCGEYGAESAEVGAETAASPKLVKQRRETAKLRELAAKGFKATKDTELAPARMLSEMVRLLAAARNCAELSCRDRITLATIQHSLCETDKYARIKAEPKKGTRFVPFGTQPAKTKQRSKIARQDTTCTTPNEAAAPQIPPPPTSPPAEPPAPATNESPAPADAAVSFLQRLRSDGPWVLTAIVPDGPTATITAHDADAVRAFIREHDGCQNIYYSANPTTRALTSKARKRDIAAAEYLFADLDPRDDESPEDAKARYLERLKTFEPCPTFVVDSGNGLQVLWRLAVAIGPGAFAQVEARTKATILALGGPPGTQNVDRILRLPGTTNLPNAKKRRTGRVPCETGLLSHTDVAHPLDSFPDLPGPDGTKRANGHDAGASINLDALPRVDVDALPVSDRIRHLIRTGEDPDDKLEDKSRSGAFWAVLLAMVGAGCDDATIAAVMLDAELPIGAHVRAQRDPGGKLAEQTAKARDRASDPAVAELNETYALVIVGNQATIMEERADGTFRLLSTTAFEEWLRGRWVRVGKRTVALAKHWREHPRRRRYSEIVFSPGGDAPGAYNLWRGFAVEPRPGDCSRFLAHLHDNVARGCEAHYNWVVGWFADIVQHPANKCGTSLVLRGKQGVGKTKVGEVIGSILGRHYTIVADPRYITGRFNSHLVDCLLLHADEGFWAGDHAAEGKLKDLITGHEHLVEFKGKEPFRVRNHVRLLVGSNADWVVPAGLEERRFAVLEVGEDHIQDGDYFAAIDAEMDAGGREALLRFLLDYDLRSVDLRTIPKTAALAEQKVSSLTAEQGWWLDTLGRGELPWGCDRAGDCPADRLFNRYVEHARRRGAPRRAIATMVGIFLHKVAPGLVKNRNGYFRDSGSDLVQGATYEFPPLADCRAAFAARMQTAPTWYGTEEWRAEPRREPDEGVL
jgi:hypothetical protein